MYSNVQKMINKTLISVVGSPNADGIRILAETIGVSEGPLKECIQDFEEMSNDIYEALEQYMRNEKTIWDTKGNKEVSWPMSGYMALHNSNFKEDHPLHNKEMYNKIKEAISSDSQTQKAFLYLSALNERVYRYGKQAKKNGQDEVEGAKKALKSLGLSDAHLK